MASLLEEARELIDEENTIVMEGFHDCLIGITSKQIAVYDIAAIIRKLRGQGMTQEEAQEYFDYNIECAHVGDYTPIFLVKLPY